MRARTATRIRLYPATWTRLPGTTWEVFLQGKRRGDTTEGVEITRTGWEGKFGGWDLHPVLGFVYTRPVRDGS